MERSPHKRGRTPSAASLLARAESLFQNGEPAKAARTARQLLKADATHVGALEVLTRALWRQGAYSEVVEATERLIRLDPYNPGYRTLHGAALQCLGRYGEAVRAYGSVGALDPQERQRAEGLIAELRAWQSALIADLLKDNAAFRVEYARDPRAACQARGFEFLESSEAIRAWVQARPQPAFYAARPS